MCNCAKKGDLQMISSSVKWIHQHWISQVAANIPINMVGIATAVQDALIQCQEPYYIYNLVVLKSQVMLEAANAGKPTPFPFSDNELIVNSHAAIDWCSAHFGSPDGTWFHTGGIGKHCLRCFRSNPVKGDNGVWKTRQSIDISIGVPTELKPKMLETLARGVQYMFDDQHIHCTRPGRIGFEFEAWTSQSVPKWAQIVLLVRVDPSGVQPGRSNRPGLGAF
ncbi:hypothetical protein OG21DRAFT_1526104 [Imleria badia]|nr:hypothetical protein OG21DRAFT_1526104 [Imleria badia]